MSDRKTIQINPDLFSVNGRGGTRKKKPTDPNKPIKIRSENTKNNRTTKGKILRYIREQQQENYEKLFNEKRNENKNMEPISLAQLHTEGLAQEGLDGASEFENSINYFKSMEEEKRAKNQHNHTVRQYPHNSSSVLTSQPYELENMSNMIQIHMGQSVPINFHARQMPPPTYGCLKNGNLPTYRAMLQQTRKNHDPQPATIQTHQIASSNGQGAFTPPTTNFKGDRRSPEKFETDKTQSFKVPLLNGNNYGELNVEDSVHFKRPKKTITIAEKIGEAETADVSMDFEKIGMDNDEKEAEQEEKELEQIEKVVEEVAEEIEKEAEKETDIVVFKPKKGKPKEKVEEEKEQDKKTDKVRQTRKTYEEFEFGKEVKVGKKLLVNRLPKREKFTVKTSNFYMNNRKLYVQKIAELFRPYRKEVLDKSSDVSCDTLNTVDFKLLTHQKVAREYLNLYTPYRGLLLFYSLGSGKSCTSIAIAESMKTQRPIVVMTPASLKMNFFSELKMCLFCPRFSKYPKKPFNATKERGSSILPKKSQISVI